jgi:membrane peptidoglycan carboxypeptidase
VIVSEDKRFMEHDGVDWQRRRQRSLEQLLGQAQNAWR